MVGAGFHGARERVTGVRVPLELEQYETDAVPGRRRLRLLREYGAVGFEGELEPAQVEEQEREIQARDVEPVLHPQGRPERFDGFVRGARMAEHDARIVPREGV